MFGFKKVILGLGLLCMVACADKRDPMRTWMEDNGTLKVLSTTAQIGDLVAEIGGERVECCVLIAEGLDPHSYELVKGDDEKLARADVTFYNGFRLEHGASLAASLRGNVRAVAVAEKIAEMVPDLILKKGDVVDPHLWMDVSLWKQGIAPILHALSEADPEGAAYYRQRSIALEQKMEAAHKAILEKMEQIPKEKRYLVTSHDAFQYFARSYLSGSAAPEGLAPDGQLSPIDIRRIIDFLKEHRVSVLFPESNVSRDSIAKIASVGKEMHIEVRICSEPLYGDATGGLTYLAMMEQNAQTIARNLQ